MSGNVMGKFTIWKAVFVAIMAAALYATVIRFAKGLGPATDLSDEFPWGLWIGFDVLVGVGVAAGGFVVAATVHVFRLKRFESIARPTILTAFLGYSLVIFALFFDLGQPWRIWHPLVMWNPHSVMFEVGWCVTLYTTVLFLEFCPLIFERLGLQLPLRLLRLIYVPLVIAGVLLSILHQSSLGTFYVLVPNKLHGLWYTPLLPVFFLISAIAAGLAMVIFESFMSYRAFRKHLDLSLLQDLGRVIVVVLGVYAVWKLEDLASRGNFSLIFQTTPESVLFWGEMGLGVLLPMLLFVVPRIRCSPDGLFLASILTVMGFVVGRLNVAITGMSASAGVPYFPTWMELAVTMGIVALGFFLFGLAVKYLPVFPEHAETPPDSASSPLAQRPVLRPVVITTLWGLLLVGFVTVSYSVKKGGAEVAVDYAQSEDQESRRVVATASLELPGNYVFPAGEDSPGSVTFRHESHVFDDEPACGRCHARLFRIVQPGMPAQGEPTGPVFHELCGSCHDGDSGFDVEEDCLYCHAE